MIDEIKAPRPHINPKTVRIVYVTTSDTKPACFQDAGCEVSQLAYAELYKILSDKKILIA